MEWSILDWLVWIYLLFYFQIKVFEFVVEQYQSDSIDFEVFDEDPGKDDFIGR